MNEQELFKILNTKDFSLRLSEDVYWVSYNELGEAQYKYEEIQQICNEKPEEKRKYVNTLCDAIQLFVAGDFVQCDDALHICEDGIAWEIYKDGYNAVASNEGCCSTCCAWLDYLYTGKYEHTGILAILRPVSGHGINYIYRDGWYYFIDMEIFLKQYRDDICPQTGLRVDYKKTKYLPGGLVKARSIEAYAHYYRRYSFNKYDDLLFIDEKGCHRSAPLGSPADFLSRHIYIPNGLDLHVVEYGKRGNIITFEYLDIPKPIAYKAGL